MPVDQKEYEEIAKGLEEKNVTLVAVSKTKSVEDIKALYDLGHRDFGENYVQEMTDKYEELPKDILWHFVGHLQSNKVNQVAAYVQLIQSVDSLKLLKEINKQAEKNKRTINCLLQVHIAQEETKFGLDEAELNVLIDQCANESLKNVKIAGLMGMASFTNDMNKVRNELRYLKTIFDKLVTHNSQLVTLSMGMSIDYKIAIEEGSNMVRIGSLLFGERS